MQSRRATISTVRAARRSYGSSSRPTGYRENDFPAELPIPASKREWAVEMLVEDSLHYPMSGPLADEEWSTVMPATGPVLALGAQKRPFTVSMLHELHCLDVLRRTMVARAGPSEEARACMNYVRQMVMCRADLTLENVRGPWGGHDVDQTAAHVCRDWSAVYNAIEQVQRAE